MYRPSDKRSATLLIMLINEERLKVKVKLVANRWSRYVTSPGSKVALNRKILKRRQNTAKLLPKDAITTCNRKFPTYVDLGCVIAVDLLFFLNMITDHLSAACDKRTIPAGPVNLSCVCVLCSYNCSRCECVVCQICPHTQLNVRASLPTHTVPAALGSQLEHSLIVFTLCTCAAREDPPFS